jgi:broad specificity phosphatase PhoE
MVRLYIIRHADPDYDTDKGQGGSLTENGKIEARALGSYLVSKE